MSSNELGSYIKRKREKMELTLKELSEEIGYSAAYISMVENGKKEKPSYEFLSEIAKGLNVNYHYLLHSAGYIDYEEFNSAIIEESREKIRLLKEEVKRIEKSEVVEDTDNLYILKNNIEVYEQGIERRLSKNPLTPSFRDMGTKSLNKNELTNFLDSKHSVYYKGEKLSKSDKIDIIKFIENFIVNKNEK